MYRRPKKVLYKNIIITINIVLKIDIIVTTNGMNGSFYTKKHNRYSYKAGQDWLFVPWETWLWFQMYEFQTKYGIDILSI